jgi:NAD(P)H-hydrate epimerase
MKILSAEDIRLWDQYTILHEPVSSLDLMERAATKCVDWLISNGFVEERFIIFCGKGNNGGDGLAIARMLTGKGFPVIVYILEFGHKGTEDFQANLAKLHQLPEVEIRFIQSAENFHPVPSDSVIIDALFGSGLNRELDAVTKGLVDHINNSGAIVISIDIPSGLFVDHSSKGKTIVKADHTLSFQCYKPAFLVAENEEFIGEVHILDIGLHPDFYRSVSSRYELADEPLVRSIHKPRKRFAHKGNYGHSLILAGSKGKAGAAVLCAKACLRSGTGLLTLHVPGSANDILQITVPEAMVIADRNAGFNTKIEEDITKYDAIGIGPGLGVSSESKMLLKDLMTAYRKPVILDADALNSVAAQKDLINLVPAGSVLTPHPKEFERLFGESANDFDRISLALQKARELNVVIVLKGHHTLIAAPDQKAFFNNTGNPGMATAGSGDVLTGILTGLLAQGYTSIESAILGVWIHGLAGDFAAKQHSMEAMIAGDIIDHLGEAFLDITVHI